MRRMEKSRRRIPLFQLFATAAGGGAGVYFAHNAPEGADVSGSLFLLAGDFTGMLLHRLAWGGAFLLAEYICGYFALGWLLVWLAPLVCGLGTGAALAAALPPDKRRACGYSCRGFRVRGCVRRRDFTEYVVADITAGFLALRRGHGFPCRRGIHPALSRLVRHIHRLHPGGMRPALPAYRVRVRSRVRSEYFADQPPGLQP